MKTSWQVGADGLACRWSVPGERILCDLSSIQEGSTEASGSFLPPARTSPHIVYWARENGMFPGICDGAYRGHHQCSEAASNRPLRFNYGQVGSYHLINS